MKRCFVMQPFDGGKFDTRFKDTIEPVIKECGFEPYRVDMDYSADILICAIEDGIASSDLCIAEITTHNPNVWYELGYAVALGKKVIMICSDEKEGAFPFDVRHRNILSYKTKSKTDFESFEDNLRKRILGINDESIDETITDLERFLINLINNNLNTPNEVVPKEKIKVEEGDVPAALKKLVTNGYLEYIYSVNESEHQSNYYRITDKAKHFISI